ncbi:hypothetical protein HNR46_000901 [Haloferula luteola]|uniref:Uncharacterized protein n=1 Tax=Haloferula luteola TaxID=595692 RepID=A0A840V069_9BACT|nr:hypothetical protein [Haloferula luteola]MBB5350673.1 hypothetical protein [Haloferula luteola]
MLTCVNGKDVPCEAAALVRASLVRTKGDALVFRVGNGNSFKVIQRYLGVDFNEGFRVVAKNDAFVLRNRKPKSAKNPNSLMSFGSSDAYVDSGSHEKLHVRPSWLKKAEGAPMDLIVVEKSYGSFSFFVVQEFVSEEQLIKFGIDVNGVSEK